MMMFMVMSMQKQGEGKVAELQAKYTKLEQDIAAGLLSQVQQEEEGKKFQEQQQQLALFEQEMTLKIQKKEAELLQPLLEKLNGAITDVAKENGMQFIFDQGTQMILFAEASTDVTNMVKTKLDNDISRRRNKAVFDASISTDSVLICSGMKEAYIEWFLVSFLVYWQHYLLIKVFRVVIIGMVTADTSYVYPRVFIIPFIDWE